MQKIHWRTDIPGSPPAIDLIVAVVGAVSGFLIATSLGATYLVASFGWVAGWIAGAMICKGLRSRYDKPRLSTSRRTGSTPDVQVIDQLPTGHAASDVSGEPALRGD